MLHDVLVLQSRLHLASSYRGSENDPDAEQLTHL